MPPAPPDADIAALDRLPRKQGFRLRGMDMTRTETFTDAAFAFAVTLMVVSIDAIPRTYDEMIAAMTGVPAFAASFALIVLFWYAHWQWSRRFGLEDVPTILLSFALVFVVLCYVYPLKYLFTGMVSAFSGGAIASGQARITPAQLYAIFAIYGAGFVALSLIIVGLNLHAWRQREKLELNDLERFDTKGEIGAWLIAAGVGVVSISIALFTAPRAWAAPGFVYMTMPVIMPLYGWRVGRRRKARFGAV